MMTLQVLVPHKAVFEGPVTKVNAEGAGGARGFLPRHIDFVMPLVTGLVSCVEVDGNELFFAVRGGVLVKKGADITIATPNAVKANSLEDLPDTVLSTFAEEDEEERASRKAVAQLETVLLREFIDLKR